MHIIKLKRKFILPLSMIGGILASGCSVVTDDLDPCPAQLRIRFVYDYNIKWGDAFPHEVSSVNVWAFDQAGRLVWSGDAAGQELASGDFYLETPLKEGEYDFVCWAGLKDNADFDLATYTPASKEDLEVTMRTIEQDGMNVSKSDLPGLFHSYNHNVRYEVDPLTPTFKTVTMSLVKDTKDIRVMLQHLDGSEIEQRDFTVTITDDNSMYGWDNQLLQPSPTVTYFPWNVKYGQTTSPDPVAKTSGSRTVTTVASLLSELSTGRLMADSKSVLTVHRNWDDRDIIRIPLVDYLLLVKGHYGDISDQEYLDRQDDYSIVFFIDPNSNWYVANGLYINGWAVVPPQGEDF